MSYTGVECVAGELDAFGLELGAVAGYIVDPSAHRLPFWATNGIPIFSGSQMPKHVSPAHCS